jgi:hypothetical protein
MDRRHQDKGSRPQARKPPKMVTKTINNVDKPVIQNVLGTDNKVIHS